MLIPLVTSAVTLFVSLPAVIYPVMFWISLLGVLAVGLREGRPIAATRPRRERPPPTASAPGPSPPGSPRPAGDGRRTRDAGRGSAPQPASSTASTRRPGIGILLTIGAGLVYWLSNRFFDAGRGDFFYLADAFLHGRTWLDVRLGPQDVILRDGHIFVPFAPFPAIALMPLVAITGPADRGPVGDRDQRRARRRDGRPAWWFTGRATSAISSTDSCSSCCSASRPRSGGSRPAAASGTPAS